MRSVNYLFKNRYINLICLFFTVVLFPAQAIFAEGSKELNANHGGRAYLVSGTTPSETINFPTNGTMKVYVKVGEVINVGSSAQGHGAGTINLRAPNGGTFTSGNSITVGRIDDRAHEFAGPLPNANGYTPYQHPVVAGEEGVWEVDFIPENGGLNSQENPQAVPSDNEWTQPSGQYIAAFDVSVRNTANSAFLTGRVYTNIFTGILGAFDVGFNGIFHILTNDGYQYTLDNNGQAGNGFSFFANNKGFRKGDGTASYLSINNLTGANVQDPRAADTPTDITHKLFFNIPAADLPATAPTPNGTTWLLTAFDQPRITVPLSFKGAEGTPGVAGTSPLGGSFSFGANKNGTYTITIDVNKNGVFTDPIDKKITGTVITGTNSSTWDGTDGQGNKVPAGSYSSNLDALLFGGEVHFPFFDVERNVNGILLTRNNGQSSPDFTVFWDDSQITFIPPSTPSSPIKTSATTGVNSQLNGHKWGTAGASPSDFGDTKGLDTWSFITNTQTASTVSLQVREANLEVTDIIVSGSGGCVGQTVTYTFTVKNNGPSDATGNKFNFTFPDNLTNVTVVGTATTGISSSSAENTTAAAYTAILSLANGAIRTYVVTGKVAATPGGASVVVTASILRTADFTDPDATNPDGAAPTDPQAECDSAPSGIGCNNIKTNTLAFLALPNAGPDQSINQGDVVTLTDTNPGVWSEYASIPQTVIATPAALTTTVSGFNDVGIYKFIRTNASGCVDTVQITVVPKIVDIPSVFTPNGDGKNDTFIVPGLLSFPGSQLLIFNRWGNEVYHSNNYQNTWDGNGLSEGTYYYVLNKKELTGNFTTFKGWVFLRRGK
jgi:gliding motility-associated-like protein/uncharacterized repeat protein (TIGR01451 family)